MDGDSFNISTQDYELNIQYAKTHKFEIVIETKKEKFTVYSLGCSVCKLPAYRINDSKFIMYGNIPLNISCSENIIKGIIE